MSEVFPKDTAKTKTITKDGQEIDLIENRNGTWRDAKTNVIVLGTDKQGSFEGGIITKEDAPLMQARKGEAAQGRARDAMLQAVQDKQLPAYTGEDAWFHLMVSLATFALNGQRGKQGEEWTRTRLDAVRLLGQATRFITDHKQVEIQSISIEAKVSEGEMLTAMFNRLHPDHPELALSELLKYRLSLNNGNKG